MGIVSSSVTDAFNKAQSYAADATAQAASFIASMQTGFYAPPQINVQWATIAPPSLPSLPSAPSLPEINFVDPGNRPSAPTVAEPTLAFDDFTEAAPSLDLPAAPTVSYGAIPTVPTLSDVALPDAPVVDMPVAPTLMGLATVAFGGVDMHEDWLANLQNVPQLQLASPTPYSYSPGPQYASELLSTLQAKLAERMQGGTGLSAAVEQAIWDRARDRETAAAQSNIDEVMRVNEALGMPLPSGALSAQLRDAQQAYYDKLSEMSRDVAIKQAELEQANLKDTIAAGMQLEGQLIDYSYKIERLAFENAVQYAANAIQVYNSQVEQYKALLMGFQTYSANYKTLIDGELAKVEAYKAQLQAEQIKAEINTTLVAQYRATIEAQMAQVEIYRAQLGGAQALVSLEQAKIAAAGEQIRAYVAGINAETSKVEAYKASVQAEATKVEVYRTKVQAFATKVGAQAEEARVQLGYYNTKIQTYAAQWEGYRSAVAAEQARMSALAAQSGALLDGYKAAAAATEAAAGVQLRQWESNIKQYEAGMQLTLQTAKINSDNIIATNNARLDASKVGAQVFAQLASSAYGMAHASTNLSGGQSMQVNYSYLGDAEGQVLIDP